MANTLVGSELRQGSGFARKGEGFRLIFGETWNFRVKTDQVTSDRLDILYNTPGLPYAGLMYGPIGLICDEVTCDRETKHALYWNVQARFQTGSEQQKSQDENNPDPDPQTWTPIFIVDSFTTRERILDEDYTTPTAKKPLNSAGTPFDTPLQTTSPLCQFSFVQFEDPGLKLKDIMDRNDCVNVATFNAAGQAFSARTLLIAVQEAELGSYAGYAAWRNKYRVTYDPLTHDEKRLDIGPYYIDPVTGKEEVCMDKRNLFPIKAALNGSGARAAAGVAPAILNFRVKKEISFNWIRT
jgi:hypothetical protein